MEFLGRFFDPIYLESLQMRAEHWVISQVLVWSTLLQVGAIVFCALLALVLSRPLRSLADRLAARLTRLEGSLKAFGNNLSALCYPAVFLALILVLRLAASSYGQPSHVLTIAVSLLSAWIVIRLFTFIIEDREWARTIAIGVWVLAALNIAGLLWPALDLLDEVGIPLGERRLSVLDIVSALILLVALLWVAQHLGRFISRRVDRSRTLTPSVKVLTQKSIQILLLASAFLITLDFLGVDLTAFAVFTGAVGVGVGFGLQKVVSNLISGFILLLDRSIKPGDVVELEDTFGWVTSLSARYVALSTRDGKEWLIPNEDLITQRVINWSYSDQKLRLPIKFGVSYHSDVRKAMELAVEAGQASDRVRADPAPVCRLTGFGDSAVELELRVWIDDPRGGVVNVKSEIYLNLWELFREHQIEIPFPQRDVHIKSDSQLSLDLPKAMSDDSA